jgi:hypothetical protein
MTLTEMRELLLAWEKWMDEECCDGDYETVEQAVEAYLEHRQSTALAFGDYQVGYNNIKVGKSRPSKVRLPVLPVDPAADKLVENYAAKRAQDAEARKQADCIGLTVPGVNAPQRFWRVFAADVGWYFAPCYANGESVNGVTVMAHAYRAEAEADGLASGLPEWRKP